MEVRGTLKTNETANSKCPVRKTFNGLFSPGDKSFFLQITLKILCNLTLFFFQGFITHHFFSSWDTFMQATFNNRPFVGADYVLCSLSFCWYYFLYTTCSFSSSPFVCHSNSQKTSFVRSFWGASQPSNCPVIPVCCHCSLFTLPVQKLSESVLHFTCSLKFFLLKRKWDNCH